MKNTTRSGYSSSLTAMAYPQQGVFAPYVPNISNPVQNIKVSGKITI
jgi:hypothetical protein